MKTPSENIAASLKGKRMLFLENDISLGNGLQEFESILKSANIDYTILFDLSDKPIEEIVKAINEHDGIVFMTQWVYDVSNKLKEYMFSLDKKKIIVEAYINEPTWYYKPKTIHDVYIYTCMVYFGKPQKETEKFYKLSSKAYWDYKNKFDK